MRPCIVTLREEARQACLLLRRACHGELRPAEGCCRTSGGTRGNAAVSLQDRRREHGALRRRVLRFLGSVGQGYDVAVGVVLEREQLRVDPCHCGDLGGRDDAQFDQAGFDVMELMGIRIGFDVLDDLEYPVMFHDSSNHCSLHGNKQARRKINFVLTFCGAWCLGRVETRDFPGAVASVLPQGFSKISLEITKGNGRLNKTFPLCPIDGGREHFLDQNIPHHALPVRVYVSTAIGPRFFSRSLLGKQYAEMP